MEESPVSDGCKVPVFSTIQDFNSFHLKRKKIRLDAKGFPREIGIGKWWVEHKDRRQYDGVVYAPGVPRRTCSICGQALLVKPRKAHAIDISLI